jgi:UDP-N-acetylmuramoyl-tripeptide--D-alanyl-D-alanine ligase
MGMYDLGEIAALCRIAEPQIGVVTNVGPTHLERLGTIERIAQAKAELAQSLPDDGVAGLNGDDARVRAMQRQTRARVVTYGLFDDNTVYADDIVTEGLDACVSRRA